MTEVVMKALGLVSGGEQTEQYPNGSFDVILSAPTLDRDGEVIESRAFEPLPDHVPFDIDHGMSVTTTVGSGRPYYDEEGNLRVVGGFASTPLAQEVRSLVNEGHIRTTSVTFMAADRVADPNEKGVTRIKRAELLNGTFTPVPSNRQAVVLSAKSAEAVGVKAGARNSAADSDRLQTIHDLSVENGAACAMKSAALAEMTWLTPSDVRGRKDATDVAQLAQAVDAPLDELDDMLAGVDVSQWPAEAQQAVALAQAASAAADDLLAALGVSDADETDEMTEQRSVDTTADAADVTAKAATSTADAADIDTARARLRLVEHAARLAFGA